MRLAIVGAGVSGLAAARELRRRRPDLDIICYEKSRGLGGRASTRRRDGFTFDHGAQYLKAPDGPVRQMVEHDLPTDTLHDIGLPVWVFDGAGNIAEGDPAQNRDAKWTYADGLNRLGKLLGDGLTVQRETRIGALERTGDTWLLRSVEGQPVGEADMVLLTPPAEQTAALLANSALDADTGAALAAELARATYRRCISFALAYNRPIMRPYYALVNNDRAHAISWLALEHRKHPDRCPPEHSLLLPQMAARWSLEHWDTPTDELAPLVYNLAGELLAEDVDDPLWWDVQRWRYALPDTGCDAGELHRLGAPDGLFFAGDYVAGQGRLHRAIESGWQAAEQIIALN